MCQRLCMSLTTTTMSCFIYLQEKMNIFRLKTHKHTHNDVMSRLCHAALRIGLKRSDWDPVLEGSLCSGSGQWSICEQLHLVVYFTIPWPSLSLPSSSPTPSRVAHKHWLSLAHFDHGSLPLIHIPVAFITLQCSRNYDDVGSRLLSAHTPHESCLVTLQSPHWRVWSVHVVYKCVGVPLDI